MVPVEQLVSLALKQTGDDYVFGVEDSRNDRDPASFDCSELVEWCCARLRVDPVVPDGAYYQWLHAKRIPVAHGIATRGALLFVGDGYGVGRDAITHVAISLGDGTTIEARGTRWGVGSWPAADRFDFAGLIPGIQYATTPAPPAPPPVALSPKDHPMVVQRKGGDAKFLAVSGHLLKFTSQTAVNDALKSLGQPAVVKLEPGEFDRLKTVAPVV